MTKDDQFYTFIVAPASASARRVRRISLHRGSLKLLAALLTLVIGAAVYGCYSLAQQARHLRIARENNRLREENERQRRQLDVLKDRVEAVEDASRRLVEMSGLEEKMESPQHGAGGPRISIDDATITEVELTTRELERQLSLYESALRERAALPSLWPAAGEISDAFGRRRDPFGNAGSEFHSGQDISAPAGTPVVAAGNGTISFAGWQNGYGSIVIVDHGAGLTTRYAHLSKIVVGEGQSVERGAQIGNVGSTGRSTGPHLHYEVRLNEIAVDPLRYLEDQD